MTTIVISSIIVIAIILIALAVRLESKDKEYLNKEKAGEALIIYAEKIKNIENNVSELIKDQEALAKEVAAEPTAPKKKKSRPRKKSAPKKKED